MRSHSGTLAHELAAILPQPAGTPFARLKQLAAAAFAIVGVFIIGFGLWAIFAPLESAAIAGGAVEAETSRKTIQHLEGGIVARILVKDGDKVTAGQPLIRLDDTRARASAQVLKAQLREAKALEARLVAERDGRPEVEFPSALQAAARTDQELAETMAGQVRIFETRHELNASRVEVIEQRKAQTREEIAALKYQSQAADRRALIIKDELSTVGKMVSKGLQTRARLLQLEREQAEIDGRVGDTMAQIARAEQSIGEQDAQILQLKSDSDTETAKLLRDTQASIFELDEKIQSALEILGRTVVRAPEDGTVTDLKVHTLGGVVVAGEPLMDLVPRQDRLIVRALVKPEDIDLVRPGLEARVRLLAYKHRRVPPVEGELVYVSADRVIDPETQHAFYTARVRIDEASLKALPGVEMMPGMPAEVMINTGVYTVGYYMVRPLFESFNRAFRED